jgi:hypothetical protein
MLSHLVYVSLRDDSCTDDEIRNILAACQRNNGKYGVTGVLLYSSRKFVQYIEGEDGQLMALYDKIKADPRHKNLMMITLAPIAERAFPSWQMGSRTFEESELDFATPMTEDEKALFREILKGAPQSGNQALALLQKLFR